MKRSLVLAVAAAGLVIFLGCQGQPISPAARPSAATQAPAAASTPAGQARERINMLYAPSADMIDYAADHGMNWVVAASTGHSSPGPADDPPVYMPKYDRLQPARQAKHDAIEAERKRLSELLGHAKARGLKAIYHSYEVSLPDGFAKTYPELYDPPIKEYRQGTSREQQQLQLCVSRPEVREALAEKVAELCRAIPEIDGYSFTFNESSSTTEVWHRCDRCRDIPFAVMMKHLHDAMAEGVRRSGRPVKLFFRCWGQHEAPFLYWEFFKKRVEWGEAELPGKEWLPAQVKAFAPANLHFVPSRDIPAFLKLVQGQDTAFIYKASWGDVNLHHPLNPWIGRYAGHDQVCEISFEQAYRPGGTFYIMGREMQRRAKACRDSGVNGICAMPVNWSANDSNRVQLHPAQSQLGVLNLDIISELNKNPDADLNAVTRSFLRARYGMELPAEAELVRMLLDTEDVVAEARNIRGVLASAGGGRDAFRDFLYSLLRYGPMYADWETRLAPTEQNLKEVFAAKDAAVAAAEKMVQRIKDLEPPKSAGDPTTMTPDEAKQQFNGKLPPKAYQEFSECFGWTLANARVCRVTHKLFLTMWAMRQGYLKPTTKNMADLQQLIADYAKVMAEQPPQQSRRR